jgi:ppGpp synthetase/RelA/SpoT-type nucleotidyltranferase
VSGTIDLAALAQEYERERPAYEQLLEALVPAIRGCLLDAGIAHVMSSRVKDYASLARKAIKKGWPDAMHRSPDLAGIRIVVPFSSIKEPVVQALHARFLLTDDDDKIANYGANEFRYLGRHMQVAFRPGEAPDAALTGREAELQLHTRAESAWAEASHDLTYKAALELPDAVQRGVNRLLALVELFDGEMGRAQDELLALPGFPAARMLRTLERVFLPLARRDFDRDLSIVVLSATAAAYGDAELSGYDALVDRFVSDAASKLQMLYARWSDDPFAHPLVLQPEALALFERLERDPTGLRDLWDQSLPPELLDQLAELWGVVLSRPGDRD